METTLGLDSGSDNEYKANYDDAVSSDNASELGNKISAQPVTRTKIQKKKKIIKSSKEIPIQPVKTTHTKKVGKSKEERSTKKKKNDPNEPKCDHCGKIFYHTSNLYKHVRTVHNKEKLFNCCNEDFPTRFSYDRHKDSFHKGGKRKKMQCPTCDFKCARNDNLKVHINEKHKKIRNHKCDLCGQSFGQSGTLKRHVKAWH